MQDEIWPLRGYLQAWGNSENALEKLKTEFAINYYKHPYLPLVGFKYNQIESPKRHPVVMASRGTVLEYGTWRCVARPMIRFFNWGEGEENKDFKWDNRTVITGKDDGSLIILYHYKDAWHVNTSGSFGLGQVGDSNYTWNMLFWETFQKLGGNTSKLNEHITYVFELCSPYNKTVRLYPESTLRLITTCSAFRDIEYDWECTKAFAEITGIPHVEEYKFNSFDDMALALVCAEKNDPTFEGFVIRDCNNLRFKCKTTTYTSLHHLHGNGNLFSMSRLVPIALRAEEGEVIAVFPEVRNILLTVKGYLKDRYEQLVKIWRQNKDIKDQKEFAIAVKDAPLSGILFRVRKEGKDEDRIQELWAQSADGILKTYEKDLTSLGC